MMAKKDLSDYGKRQRSLRAKVVSAVKAATNNLDMPAPGDIWGIDTSTHVEGVPNWEVARARGCAFADIKVINGLLEVPRWKESWAGAKRAGLPRIAYGWVYPNLPGGGRDPRDQAKRFVDLLAFDPPEIFYQVDFETTYGGNPTLRDLWVYLETLEALTGRIPSIYTGYWFWKDAVIGSSWPNNIPYYNSHPIWRRFFLHIANYGTLNPSIPEPWLAALLHQWTEDGNGVAFGFDPYDARRIDLNRFLGTPQQWAKLAGGMVPIPPVVTPPPVEPPPTPPSDHQEFWFNGAVEYRKYAGPHGADYHLLRIATKDIEDIVVDPRWTRMSTTNWFTAKKNLHLAINGLDQFSGGKLGGFAAYHGQGTNGIGGEETLYISKDLKFSLARPRNIWTATSFPNCLVRDGALQRAAYYQAGEYRARTAFGVSEDQSYIIILVADGGDYGEGIGLDFLETANILKEAGAHLGVMADGGGSTTLVKRGDDGKPQIVGIPSGENPPDANGIQQRSVAQHLGIRLKNTL